MSVSVLSSFYQIFIALLMAKSSRQQGESDLVFLSSTSERILTNNLPCLSRGFYAQYPFLFLTGGWKESRRLFSSPSFQVWLRAATHLNSSSQHDGHKPHGHAQCL